MITDAPNLRWGTDATMAWTKTDGWVWVFVLVDHHTDEEPGATWPGSAAASPPSSPSMTP